MPVALKSLWHRAQLAVDATSVSPVSRNGWPHRSADTCPGTTVGNALRSELQAGRALTFLCGCWHRPGRASGRVARGLGAGTHLPDGRPSPPWPHCTRLRLLCITLLELPTKTPAEATDGLNEPPGDLLAGGPTPDVSRLPAAAH